MKVVIAGAGGIGRYLAAELRSRGHDLTIVEKRDEAISRVPDGIRVVHGDACAPSLLEVAGVREADVVVAIIDGGVKIVANGSSTAEKVTKAQLA